MEGLENHPLLAPPAAKKRGRPPGSKNKKTLEAIQLKAESSGLEPVVQPADPVPEDAVIVAAAASGILDITPSKLHICAMLCYHSRKSSVSNFCSPLLLQPLEHVFLYFSSAL